MSGGNFEGVHGLDRLLQWSSSLKWCWNFKCQKLTLVGLVHPYASFDFLQRIKSSFRWNRQISISLIANCSWNISRTHIEPHRSRTSGYSLLPSLDWNPHSFLNLASNCWKQAAFVGRETLLSVRDGGLCFFSGFVLRINPVELFIVVATATTKK